MAKCSWAGLVIVWGQLEAQWPNCLNYAVAADTSLEYIQPRPLGLRCYNRKG